MIANRLAAAGRRIVALLGAVLVLVLCTQFVVVAIDKIEHRLGIDHAPTSLAGTVVKGAMSTVIGDSHDYDHDHDHHHDGDGGSPDHSHIADAAPSTILCTEFASWSPMYVIALLRVASVPLLHGLPGGTLQRPPNSLV